MKILLLLIVFITGLVKGWSQIPQFINYQAVARYNNSNLPIPHQPVTVNFKIREGGVLGRVLFNESHVDTTDDCGLFNLKIGAKQLTDFKKIDWSTGAKFLEVNINGVVSGISELSSNPYAFYSSFAESAKSSLDWKNVGDTILYSKDKKIGIGITNPIAPLDINNYMRIKSDNTGPTRIRFDASSATDDHWVTSFDEKGNRIWALNFADRLKANRFGLFSDNTKTYVFNIATDGNVGIKTDPVPAYSLSVKGDINIEGSGSVSCLTIKGGCDWYEEANSAETILPGYVAVIDPGAGYNAVKTSSKPYDKMVTGVVSGAGGINSGIGLQQQGVLEGNTKIAMGGKVKVYVIGEVRPGDLITSSNRNGYAMAVKNRKKAFGAVLGKALSAPDKEGLVLMQVMMN